MKKIIDGKLFIDELKKQLDVTTDNQLGKLFGHKNISQYKKGITIKALVSMVKRYSQHRSIITPLFEIYPIKSIEEEDKNKKLLKNKIGIYALFDSSGQVIYVGKTKKQNFFSEIFNTRLKCTPKGNHVIYRSKKPSSEKSKPEKVKLTYKDITMFFSAYLVEDGHINDIEALLIRILSNNSMNVKMEKFKFNVSNTNFV